MFAVVGGALSLAFALLRTKNYQSWATLFYQERIQSQLLTPNREEVAQRNIGDKYRELLLARAQLEKIVADPALNPFPKEKDKDVAIDKLRQAVKLEVRGGNAFRIVYGDAEPDRAKAVTEKLTKMLQDKDEALRNEQAKNTVEFATTQKDEAQKELRAAELRLAEFLAKHPEFAQDGTTQTTEGASIRAMRKTKPATTGNSKVGFLERQRERLQARLDAPPDARIIAPPTPERMAAERAVDEAQRELSAAKRELDDAQSKYMPKHPAVINAQERVTKATQRLRQAEGNVPADVMMAPKTPQDRENVQRELARIDQQIATLQKSKGGVESPSNDASTNWIVKLETEHTDIRRDVNEQRERVEALADSVFRSQIDASQKLAEAGGRLAIIDPAFRPVKPSGPGKTIFLMAGMALFLSLGLALAVGLAVIDDRLYRRSDLDQLGIMVLAVIPPATATIKKSKRKDLA
ncbi:MAG: hypothetical protein H0T89_09890 [Deltaproteobacteria bacterium]|nr:hypothetical protein [Deltaproteobacteria bacterium]